MALVPSLPSRVWLLLRGETLAAAGNGLTLPFLLVYLVKPRDIEVEMAALALASLAAADLVGNPLGGSLSDRIGARRTLVGGLVLVSVGALGLVLVRKSWHALMAAALLGLGAAVVWPSQDTLLAGLAGPEAATAVVVRWRALLADRALYGLLPLVTLLFAAGYAQYHAAFPAYATGPGGLPVSALGAVFAANTLAIVAAQLVVFKVVEGWRRSRGLAVVGLVWASAWLVALVAGGQGGGLAAAALFAVAMALFGLGETVLAPSLGPLVNDLAPERLRGRYDGASALASTAGFMIGPAVAGAALAAGGGTTLVWGLAGACALAVLGAMRLERRLPAHANEPKSVVAHARPLAGATSA